MPWTPAPVGLRPNTGTPSESACAKDLAAGWGQPSLARRSLPPLRCRRPRSWRCARPSRPRARCEPPPRRHGSRARTVRRHDTPPRWHRRKTPPAHGRRSKMAGGRRRRRGRDRTCGARTPAPSANRRGARRRFLLRRAPSVRGYRRGLFAGTAEVKCRGRRDPVIRPRDVAVEHEVDLGYPGSKSVPAQCGRVPVGDRVPIHLQQCRGCGVEDGDALGRFGHLDPGGQLAAARAQIGDQRVGNHLAAADRDGPADPMGQGGQHQPRAGRHQRRQRRNSVGSNAGEQCAGIFASESAPCWGALRQDA